MPADEHPQSVRDKVVLLTGATGPMGRILLDAFLDAGAKLAICVRRMINLPALEQRMAERGEAPMIVPADLRFEENVVRMIHRVVHRFGRIDVIVNAAAILGPRVPLIDYPAEPWRDVLSTNVNGVYMICREALPWLIRQKSGSIINVTTSLSQTPKPEWGAYLVANHAIEGLTKLLALELKDTGVRANVVDVGMMTSEVKPAGQSTNWTKPFLWLASDESIDRTGDRINAAAFAS